MSLFEEKQSVQDDEEVIALLNARSGRHRQGNDQRDRDAKEAERFILEMGTTSETTTSAREASTFPGWDDGGAYARAAEAAGVDVGGMLEAGVDAQQLLEFVSNYRKDQGDKLGLLDEQNLKFATSQVLRGGQRGGAKPVSGNTRGVRISDRRPTAGVPSARGFAVKDEKASALRQRNGAAQARRHQSPLGRADLGEVLPTKVEGEHPRGDRPSAPAPAHAFGVGDGVETARLCDELLRWSSALQGAERQLEGKGTVSGGRRTGGDGRRIQATVRVPAEGAVGESSEQATPPRGDIGEIPNGVSGSEGDAPPRDMANSLGRPHPSRGQSRGSDRRRSHCQDAAEVNGCRDRSSSLEHSSEWDWAEGDEGPASSTWRQGGLGRASAMDKGHILPTPSYALPTKHFKTLPRRDRTDAVHAEDAHRKKQLQRKAHLEEENVALKLRLEGQRRAIHELEHQAHTLREEARIREDELSRLSKKLLAASSWGAGGKCSYCASTHNARARAGGGGNGASVLKKRALAAEARIRALEGHLADGKAKEQRSREIVASLKHSYSGSQDRVACLETELEATGKSLSEARRDLAEGRRNAKMRAKDTRKYRRQQGERSREVEIARAEAADLSVQLRRASKEGDRARLEAVALREEKSRVETQANALTRENRVLQDRLNGGQLRDKARERERWILSELRSESNSPTRRPTHGVSGGTQSRNAANPRSSMNQREQEALHAAPRRRSLTRSPSDDFWTRWRSGGRRRRLGEDALNVSSESESSVCLRSLSPLANVTLHAKEVLCGASGRLPPKDGRRIRRSGDAGAAGGGGTTESRREVVRTFSTRSAEEGVGSRGAFGGSTLSAGSTHSTMGARYDRLQAMYKRVNRRDAAGNRGRAGVG